MRGTVAIIGGGIGGLAVAAALHRAGWEATVFEREPGLSGAGTALGIWPSALAALDRIDLGARVRTIGTPQAEGVFLRADGSRIGRLDANAIRRRTGDSVHLLSRPALLDLLRGAAAEGSALRFGQPVDAIGGLARSHDLVVAADGIFSRAREELFGGRYPAQRVGVTAWRGWIDDRPTDRLVETWGPGRKFGITPQENNRTNWYATTASQPHQNGALPRDGNELARLREMFGAWKGPVAAVLDDIREEGILRHDLFVVPRLPTYVRGNVALIGDAAHAMTPDLGRGACEALVDAIALADAVSGASTVEGGLSAYDRARRHQTQRLARAAGAASRLTEWTRHLWWRDRLLALSLRLPLPA